MASNPCQIHLIDLVQFYTTFLNIYLSDLTAFRRVFTIIYEVIICLEGLTAFQVKSVIAGGQSGH